VHPREVGQSLSRQLAVPFKLRDGVQDIAVGSDIGIAVVDQLTIIL